MRELWGQKRGLAIALVLATLAVARVLGFSLFPPSLEGNSLSLASASTEVLVDSPRSAVIDLRQDLYSFTELTNRTLLLGNVMGSLPVRAHIGRRAGVPPDAIRISAPLTPEQPRAIAGSMNQPKTTDILKSPDEYRLSIQANPTVPLLKIYSEAPDDVTAGRLANAAVDGLRDYLRVIAAEHPTPGGDQVKLVQLGRATGRVVNPGAGIQMAVLAFVFVFTVSSVGVLFIGRVRRGWVSSEGLSSPPAGDLP